MAGAKADVQVLPDNPSGTPEISPPPSESSSDIQRTDIPHTSTEQSIEEPLNRRGRGRPRKDGSAAQSRSDPNYTAPEQRDRTMTKKRIHKATSTSKERPGPSGKNKKVRRITDSTDANRDKTLNRDSPEDVVYDSSCTASEEELDPAKPDIRVVKIWKKHDDRPRRSYRDHAERRASKNYARAIASHYTKLFRYEDGIPGLTFRIDDENILDPINGGNGEVPAMIRQIGTFHLIPERRPLLNRNSKWSRRPTSFLEQLHHPFSVHLEDELDYYINFLENDDPLNNSTLSEEQVKMQERTRTLDQLNPSQRKDFWLSSMDALYKDRDVSGDFFVWHMKQKKTFRVHEFILEMSGGSLKRIGEQVNMYDVDTRAVHIIDTDCDSSVIEAIIAATYRQDYIGGEDRRLLWHAEVFELATRLELHELRVEILDYIRSERLQSWSDDPELLAELVEVLTWNFTKPVSDEIYESLLTVANVHMQLLMQRPGFEELQQASRHGSVARESTSIVEKLALFQNAIYTGARKSTTRRVDSTRGDSD